VGSHIEVSGIRGWHRMDMTQGEQLQADDGLSDMIAR
jgi:hypothetical protein